MLKKSWKNIKGYEGLYRISSHGDIVSAKTGQKKKTFPNKEGYLWVTLSNMLHNFPHCTRNGHHFKFYKEIV